MLMTARPRQVSRKASRGGDVGAAECAPAGRVTGQRRWRARNGRTAATKPAGLSPITEWPAPATSGLADPGRSRVIRSAVLGARSGRRGHQTSGVGTCTALRYLLINP